MFIHPIAECYQRRSSLLATHSILFSPEEYLDYTIVLGAHSLVIHVLLIENRHAGIHILIIKTPIYLQKERQSRRMKIIRDQRAMCTLEHLHTYTSVLSL